jgi:hypothetical protein
MLTVAIAAGCDRNPTAAPVGAAIAADASAPDGATAADAAARTDASGPATEAPPPDATYDTFTGKVSGEAATLVVERRGETLRLAYLQGDGLPTVLVGKVTGATRLHAEARGKAGAAATALDGAISDDGRFSGSLSDPMSKTKTAITLARGADASLTPDAFEASYAGTLGKSTRVRLKWKRDKHLLTGVYRYARSKEDLTLSGTVIAATGAFVLTEKSAKGAVTGRWRGVLIGTGAAMGSWSNAEGTRSLPITLERSTEYPEIAALPGGVRVIPQEAHAERGPSCTLDVTRPTFDGLASKAAQASLEAELTKQSGGAARLSEGACEGSKEYGPFTFERSYAVTGSRPGFVGLELSEWSFTGGAHGNRGASCVVVDTTRGAVVSLGKELPAASRTKLAALVNASLRAQNNVEKLSEAGFFDDVIALSEDPSLCLVTGKPGTALEVVFSPYEVGPWAMGEVRAKVDAATARTLFAPGTAGAEVFR